MFDVGGADEEEIADEDLFGNSAGLKGTEKLLFGDFFVFFLMALTCLTLEVQMRKNSRTSIRLEILKA